MTKAFKLALVAGEASGDALAARFIDRLHEVLAPREVELVGVGGAPLIARGLKPLFPQADISVMGFGPVIQRLPKLLRRMDEAAAGIVAAEPDLLLTVDSPDFTLRVAKRVRSRARAIPIVHWVCPSVWAWRSGRARRMKPHVDRILALLPFEPEALARLDGPDTIYVGHPLIERLDDFRPDDVEAPARQDADKPQILILPGSRRSEIRHLMPVFGKAVERIGSIYPDARFMLPAVAHLAREIAVLAEDWAIAPEIVIGEPAKLAAFRRARAALAASGTVTLELALAQVPTVAAYRGADWEAALARRLVKLPSVILPNLVLGRNVVPEFIQHVSTPEALAGAMLEVLREGEPRDAQLAGFAEVEAIMRGAGLSPAANAVDAALAVVDGR